MINISRVSNQNGVSLLLYHAWYTPFWSGPLDMIIVPLLHEKDWPWPPLSVTLCSCMITEYKSLSLTLGFLAQNTYFKGACFSACSGFRGLYWRRCLWQSWSRWWETSMRNHLQISYLHALMWKMPDLKCTEHASWKQYIGFMGMCWNLNHFACLLQQAQKPLNFSLRSVVFNAVYFFICTDWAAYQFLWYFVHCLFLMHCL